MADEVTTKVVIQQYDSEDNLIDAGRGTIETRAWGTSMAFPDGMTMRGGDTIVLTVAPNREGENGGGE